jgi:hypothetical protein
LTINIENAATEQTNAIALWSFYYKVLDVDAEQARFLNLCQAEGINTVWMALDVDSFHFFNNDPGYRANAYQTFISAASSMGIRVYAMLGGVDGVLATPEAHRTYIEATIRYNALNPSTAFSGILWDIEHVSDYAAYTSYIRTLKSYSFNGQTIVSQGLKLGVYADAYDTPTWREFIREFHFFASNSYADGLTTGGDGGGVVQKAGAGPVICQQEGVEFLIGLETDELADFHDPYTLYEEGKDGYHELESQIDDYFIPRYTQYSGQYVHHYQRAVETWHTITSVEWPSANFSTGQTVPVTVNLRSSGWYQNSARGVELQVRDAGGTVWKTGKVVVVPSLGTRSVTLQCRCRKPPTPGAMIPECRSTTRTTGPPPVTRS